MNYYEIVMKLVGPVRPVGDCAIDGHRFENLETLTALIDDLLTEVDHIATEHAGSHEHSRNKAGTHCSDFLDRIGIEE